MPVEQAVDGHAQERCELNQFQRREGECQEIDRELDIVDIEWRKETVTRVFKGWDARFVYRDGDVERKRWVRTMFWGDAQLTFIAQGKDVATYEYYAGMFYNSLMTFELV